MSSCMVFGVYFPRHDQVILSLPFSPKRITKLESQISNNSFDNKQLFGEAKAIFSSIQGLSIANHTYIIGADSSKTVTVAIYDSPKPLSKEESKKMNIWLKKRLTVPSVEIYHRINQRK